MEVRFLTHPRNGYNMDYKSIKASMQAKYIYCDDIVEGILLSYETNQPILLHGPGGHAKTQLARDIGLSLYPKEDIRVVLYGRGTIPSSVLGGVDFKTYKEDGLLEYMPQRSWMASKMVISEEFLDAPKTLIEQFKYIMSERQFPMAGGGFFNLETELHVGCTNYTPSKWAETESDKALLGRFPLKLEVKWPRYEAKDFAEMISKYYPDKAFWAVAEAAALCHMHGVKISPRDVMYICKQFALRKDLNIFRFNEEVAANAHLLAEIIKMAGKIKHRAKVREMIDACVANLAKMPKPSNDILLNQRMVNVLNSYNNALQGVRTDDSNVANVNTALKMVRELKLKYEQASAKATQLSLNDTTAFQLPEVHIAE